MMKDTTLVIGKKCITLGYYSVNDGGGATDIRLISGNWDSFESLKSRIMVAGGSSGGATV